MVVSEREGLVQVFRAFNQGAAHPFPYPEDNMCIFEEWYCENFRPEDARQRIYLPIFWTGYYVRANYGKDKLLVDHLQGYINALDRSRKYYTIVQFDDGIINDLSGLDIRVYSMSGKPMDYPLPLICQRHDFHFLNLTRDIDFSFVGRITHPVRAKILAALGKRAGCYVTERHHSLEEYCKILARSVYALCPRGYGPSSFRICEALQFGAIPVYISDDHILAHRHTFPGILMDIGESVTENFMISLRLDGMGGITKALQDVIPGAYKDYYTYAANKKLILEDLNKQNL